MALECFKNYTYLPSPRYIPSRVSNTKRKQQKFQQLSAPGIMHNFSGAFDIFLPFHCITKTSAIFTSARHKLFLNINEILKSYRNSEFPTLIQFSLSRDVFFIVRFKGKYYKKVTCEKLKKLKSWKVERNQTFVKTLTKILLMKILHQIGTNRSILVKSWKNKDFVF